LNGKRLGYGRGSISGAEAEVGGGAASEDGVNSGPYCASRKTKY
jgi:hypothetical protein